MFPIQCTTLWSMIAKMGDFLRKTALTIETLKFWEARGEA